MGLYHVVLTTTKTSPEKFTLDLVDMHYLPDIEKTDSKKETSCLKCRIYNGRRDVCVNFQTDTEKLNIVVYRYRNSFYLFKYIQGDLKLSEYQSFLAKRVHLFSYIDIFYERCIVLDEKTVHKENRSFPHEYFPIVPGNKNVI